MVYVVVLKENTALELAMTRVCRLLLQVGVLRFGASTARNMLSQQL